MIQLQEIKRQSRQAAEEICEASGIRKGQIFVVGCSSSEVLGSRIGTATNVEVAEAIYDGIADVLENRGVFLAGQCCEHLNRAIVLEREAAKITDGAAGTCTQRHAGCKHAYSNFLHSLPHIYRFTGDAMFMNRYLLS